MSMAPITFTQDGKTFTFLLPSLAALNAVLTSDALNEAYRPNANNYGEAWQRVTGGPIGGNNGIAAPTQSWWADTLAASSPAAMSQIPVSQIRSVLGAALAGGGLTAEQPVDVAERLLRNQNGRDVDLLCAAIVKAAIAAG